MSCAHCLNAGCEHNDTSFEDNCSAPEEICNKCDDAEWDDEADIHIAAVSLGRKGGLVKSAKKALSSAENGKKGGRPTEKKTYWILSGEGEEGTWEKHIATLTGIKRIATKERCNGDRFARIWEEIHETETTNAHIYDIDNGDMRDVPDED